DRRARGRPRDRSAGLPPAHLRHRHPAARLRLARRSAPLPGLRGAAPLGLERGGHRVRRAGRHLRRELPVRWPSILGALVLVAAWVWPLPALPWPPFAAHMTAHIAVVALVCPLLAAGVAGGALDP